MSTYSNTVTDYLENYLKNAAYNLFELEDISIPQLDTYGNTYSIKVSPLFLQQVVDVPQNQELLDIIMEEVPLYYIEPVNNLSAGLEHLTSTRDIGQIDVPSALQSDFWEVWFRNSFGDIHNNLLLDIFNKMRYPFVNENQYLSAMLFSELADKAYYASSNTTVENKLSFQDKDSDNIEYLNNIMDTKLASIYSMLDYAPNQSELISYWTESLYESGQMSAEDISKESEVFKLQDLKHELYRRKFAGSVTLYNLALKSVNLQGTISGTLQVSAFGVLQKQFNDTRLIRLLSAYELISGSPMVLEFSPIKEFYDKKLGTNNSAIPLGILEPLYYTSAPTKINGYQQQYSAQKFYFEPAGEEDVFEGLTTTRDAYQKALLRNQNTVLNWITPERVLSNIDQSFYLTLDDRMEDDSSEIRLKLDKGVQLVDQYLDLITLDVSAKPISLTAYTNTAIDISVNKFYYYRNILQEKQADSYPFLTSRIAKGNSVTLIDSKWMNYIQTITEAKSKVGDIPSYGAQVSKFYPYTDTIFKERPFFYLIPHTDTISSDGKEIQYADLYYLIVKTNQNNREIGSFGLIELLSRSHIARILLPRELEEGEHFDPEYPTERDISYTYARGILPFTYAANELIDPGKTIYNSVSISDEGTLVFHDNITDRGYTPVIYVFSNLTLCPSPTEIEVPSGEPATAYPALKTALEDMGYTLTPQEDTVFIQYLVKFDNVFRLSEPIYILNGMVEGDYTSFRPRLAELLDTGKLVWSKLKENYRSEYTSLSLASLESSSIYTSLIQNGVYLLPQGQHLQNDDDGLLLWINPYLNFTPNSSSPLRHIQHAEALPEVGSYDIGEYFRSWDRIIFPDYPDSVEEPEKGKTYLPSDSSALQNLSSANMSLRKRYIKVNTTTGQITNLSPPTSETTLEIKQSRLTINTISGDTSEYDYNYLYRYFSGYGDNTQDPVTIHKDSRGIPILDFSPSMYRQDSLDDPESTSKPTEFSLVYYEIKAQEAGNITNPIFCLNVKPYFTNDFSEEKQCLLTIADSFSLYVHKTGDAEAETVTKTLELRKKKNNTSCMVVASIPFSGEEARVTLAYSSRTETVTLIANNYIKQFVIEDFPVVGRIGTVLNVKLFFDSTNVNEYAFPYKGSVYDIRLYDRSNQLFDLFSIHMGTFRELYSYSPFNNILGYNIYKDLGITKILYGNYATEKLFPSITHFRAFKRSVWDSILLDTGFEAEDFDVETDLDIVDPEDSNNSYAISQKLIEKVETLSNQSVSREDAIEVVSSLGRHTIRNNDIYTIASLMLYPVKYDDAEFTFDANKINVTLNSDLTTLTLSNLMIPVSGDTSTLSLSTTLSPNFLVENKFNFTSAESTGSGILSQHYDSTAGIPMVKRVAEKNSVRDVNLNFISVPIFVPAVTEGYISGLVLGKTQLSSSLTALLKATSYYDELQIPGLITGVTSIEYTKYSALRFLKEGSYFITCSYPLQIRPYNRSALPEAQEYPILYGKIQFKIEVSSDDHELDETAKKSQDTLSSTITSLETFSIDPADNRTFPHKDINIRLYVVDNPLLVGATTPIYKLLASNVPSDVFDYVLTSDTVAQTGVDYYTLTSPYYVEAPFSAEKTYHKTTSGMVRDPKEPTTTSSIHYARKENVYVKAQVKAGDTISGRTLYKRQAKNNGVLYLNKAQLSRGLYVEGLKLFLGENYKAPFWTAADEETVPSSRSNTAAGSGTFKQYVIGLDNLPGFGVEGNKAYTLLLDYDAYISEFTFIDNSEIPDTSLRSSLSQAVNHISNPDKYFYSGAPIAIEESSAVRMSKSGFQYKRNTDGTWSWVYGKQKQNNDEIQYFGNPNARSTDKNFLVSSGKSLSMAALKQAMDSYSYPISSDNVNALYLTSTRCYTNSGKTASARVNINEKSLLTSIRDTRVRNIKTHILNFSSTNLMGILTGLSSFSLMVTNNAFVPLEEVPKPEIMDNAYSYFKYLGSTVPVAKRNNLQVESDTFYQNNLFSNTDFSDTSRWRNKAKVNGNWVTNSTSGLTSYVADPWIDGTGKMVYSMQGAQEYMLEYINTGVSYTDHFEIALSVKTPDNSPVTVQALCYENSSLKETVVLPPTTENNNKWFVYSGSKNLSSVNTITFTIRRAAGAGIVYVSKPVARVRNHISGTRGFSNVERTERSTNDTNTFSITYPNTIVLKNNETQGLVPISFDPKVISANSSVQVVSGAQVMSGILSNTSTIGTAGSTQYLVPIISPWDRMITLSGYDPETKKFEDCYSYSLYTEASNNTEIKKTIDATVYNMNGSEFEFNEVVGTWSGSINLTSTNIFKSNPCNLSVRRDSRSLRLKNSSFSLLTNCFNPEAVLEGEDSEVCITNIQAYNVNEDLQEQRILEIEYLPLIYNELSQHISINLMLNRMTSYAPVLVGDISKELYNTRLPVPQCHITPGITSDYGTLSIANPSAYQKFGDIQIKIVQNNKVLKIDKCDSINVNIDSNHLIYATAMGEGDFEPGVMTTGFNPQLQVQEPVEALYLEDDKLWLYLECDTPDSVIRYTVSETNSLPQDPTEFSTLYTGPIEYPGKTIKARAFKPNLNASEVLILENRMIGYASSDSTKLLGYEDTLAGFQGNAAAAQEQRLPTPELLCTYSNLQSCVFTLSNESDYTEEDVHVAIYADGEKLETYRISDFSFTTTVNAEYSARAFCTGCRGSLRSDPIQTELQAPAPEIRINTSDSQDNWTVEFSYSLDGCVIHYTLNGSTPTEESPIYTEPIAYHGETVKAMAVKTGMINSTVTVAASSVLQLGEDMLRYDGDLVGYNT